MNKKTEPTTVESDIHEEKWFKDLPPSEQLVWHEITKLYSPQAN